MRTRGAPLLLLLACAAACSRPGPDTPHGYLELAYAGWKQWTWQELEEAGRVRDGQLQVENLAELLRRRDDSLPGDLRSLAARLAERLEAEVVDPDGKALPSDRFRRAADWMVLILLEDLAATGPDEGSRYLDVEPLRREGDAATVRARYAGGVGSWRPGRIRHLDLELVLRPEGWRISSKALNSVR